MRMEKNTCQHPTTSRTRMPRGGGRGVRAGRARELCARGAPHFMRAAWWVGVHIVSVCFHLSWSLRPSWPHPVSRRSAAGARSVRAAPLPIAMASVKFSNLGALRRLQLSPGVGCHRLLSVLLLSTRSFQRCAGRRVGPRNGLVLLLIKKIFVASGGAAHRPRDRF